MNEKYCLLVQNAQATIGRLPEQVLKISFMVVLNCN